MFQSSTIKEERKGKGKSWGEESRVLRRLKKRTPYLAFPCRRHGWVDRFDVKCIDILFLECSSQVCNIVIVIINYTLGRCGRSRPRNGEVAEKKSGRHVLRFSYPVLMTLWKRFSIFSVEDMIEV